MSNEPNTSIVGNETVEWACDNIRGFVGYSVHIDNGVWPEDIGFPAFTHEQMEEAKRICETLGSRFSWDEFPHLVYNESEDTWSEIYYDDMSDTADVLKPFYVDGLKLYALGSYTDWPWGEIMKDYEYIEV